MFFFYFFCILILNTSFAQDVTPSLHPVMEIPDLQSLYDAGEVDEFLDHAKDIRPAVRGPKWRKMVMNFTKKKIESLLAEKNSEFNDILKMEEIAAYPFQKGDYDLQSKKLELGINFLTQTFQKIELIDSNKIKEISRWWTKHWESSLKLPIYAYRYAKLFEEQKAKLSTPDSHLLFFFEKPEVLNNYMSQFFKIVYKSNLAKDLCQDSWLWKYLWPNLKEFGTNLKKKDLEQFDLKIANEFSLNCWKSARGLLLKNLNTMPSDDQFIALHMLSIDRSMESMDKKFVHLYYLLNNPQFSDLLNKSLETLMQLSRDENSRLALLKIFQNLDPLLGRSFSSESKDMAQNIIKKFIQSFPEYIDFYARSCMDYLGGFRKFPKGNPTPDCLAFCKRFVKMDDTFFSKPVYKLIPYKFMGQCNK